MLQSLSRDRLKLRAFNVFGVKREGYEKELTRTNVISGFMRRACSVDV